MSQLSAPASLYRHSGKVPPTAAVLALIAAIVAAALLGSIYGGLQFLIELIAYVKARSMILLVLLLGFAFLLGFLPTFILVQFKARSTPIALFFAAIASLFAYYFAWVGWFYAHAIYLNASPSFTYFLNPFTLFPSIAQLYTTGFSRFVDQASGPSLGILWLAEFTTIIGFAGAIARTNMNSKIFCESCHTWGTLRPLMKIKDLGEISKLKSTLASGDLSPLTSATSTPGSDSSWVDVSLEGCPTCDNLQTLSVTHFNILKTKNGATTKKNSLLKRLLLTPDQTVSLALAASALTTPPPLETAPAISIPAALPQKPTRSTP